MTTYIWFVLLAGFAGCNPPGPDPPVPESTAGEASAASSPEGITQRVKAEVGVGKQGRSLDNETGVGSVIVEPARQLFRVKERAVFEIQIPQALQLFRATNGRLPDSHDEFMSQIIEANRIQLPELPAGQKYVFDPEAGELMVEKPAT